MENNKEGNVRGWNGVPGPQGHWIATLKDTVTIGDEAVVKYTFSPEKWPKWFMYMEDNKEGNIRGWNGDPGSQGYFIMKYVPDWSMQVIAPWSFNCHLLNENCSHG